MSHVSTPQFVGSESLSPAPFTGYGVEMNNISDYVWTFYVHPGITKEVYRETHFPFMGR